LKLHFTYYFGHNTTQNIIKFKLHFSLSSLQKKKIHGLYIYHESCKPKVHNLLLLTFSTYIFSESIFLKYHCTFSLYKVTNFTIRKFPCLLKGIFCRYWLPDLLGTTCYYQKYWSPDLLDNTCYYHNY